MSMDPAISTQVLSAPSAMQRAQTAAVSEKAGIVFYRFQGRPIKTTRPWCLAREGKVWHIEEIREWGRQAAAGQGWDGMVEGTDEQTIMTYLGGWYGNRSACRHVLVPVLPSRVPTEDMERMRAKGLWGGIGAPSESRGALSKSDSDTVRELRESWAETANNAKTTDKQDGELGLDYGNRVAPNLTNEERSLLRSYTNEYSDEINTYLRNVAGGEPADISKIGARSIEVIRSVISKHPLQEALTVYRGVTDSKAARRFIEIAKKTTTGTELAFDSFTSTSLRADLPFMKKSDLVLRMRLPAGSKALYLKPISGFKYERELLLDVATKFRVLGFEVIDGKTYVDLIAIP